MDIKQNEENTGKQSNLKKPDNTPLFKENMPATGWKPLPLPLKILFAVLVLSVLSSLISLGKNPFIAFGFHLTGTLAIIASLLLNILSQGVLALALWKRVKWAWKYGVAYITLFFLNGLITLILFLKTASINSIGAISSLMLIILVLELALLIAFFRQKKYFS